MEYQASFYPDLYMTETDLICDFEETIHGAHVYWLLWWVDSLFISKPSLIEPTSLHLPQFSRLEHQAPVSSASTHTPSSVSAGILQYSEVPPCTSTQSVCLQQAVFVSGRHTWNPSCNPQYVRGGQYWVVPLHLEIKTKMVIILRQLIGWFVLLNLFDWPICFTELVYWPIWYEKGAS